MKSPYSSLHPQVEARVVGVDIARGLALMGIMYAHLHPPTPLVPYIMGNGVAPALFAILSGVAMAFVAGGLAPLKATLRKGVYISLALRAIMILLLGLTLGLVENSIYIILVQFGVLFLVAIPLLEVRKEYLYPLAFFWAMVMPFGSYHLRQFFEPARDQNLSFMSLGDPGHFLSEVFLVGNYPVVFWFGYMMLGVAIGRTDLRRLRNIVYLALAGSTLALVSILISQTLMKLSTVRAGILAAYPGLSWSSVEETIAPGLFGVTPREGGMEFLAVASPHSGTPFDLLFTGGAAMAILAVCVLGYSGLQALPGGNQAADALRLFFGTGRITLTLYSLHVLMNTAFLPPGEYPPRLDIHYIVILSLGMVFALFAWRGPLEWAVAWPGKYLAARPHSGNNAPRVV